jgi:hypothetical protein
MSSPPSSEVGLFLQHLRDCGNVGSAMARLRSVEGNRYRVEVERERGLWTVRIVDPGGRTVLSRACGDEEEARTFASTVRQHAGWLSERRFREYYQLPQPEEPEER